VARIPTVVPLAIVLLTLSVSTATAKAQTAAPEAKPVITGLSLGSGTPKGGSELVITGTKLDGLTAVTFGGTKAAPATYATHTEIDLRTPSHAPGVVQVKVVTSHGTSSATAVSAFEYFRPARGGALTWTAGDSSQPTQATQSGFVETQVACPATNDCVALDTGGHVSYYRGTSWSKPSETDDQGMVDLSCPTTTFCMAVDAHYRVLSYDGTSWTAPSTLVPGAKLNVSCSSATFCLAVTDQNDYLFYNGTSWTAPAQVPLPDTASGVYRFDCSPADYCLAWASGATRADNGELVSFDGTSWTDNGNYAGDEADLGYPDSVEQVSCQAARICALFGDADALGFVDNGSSTHGYSEGGDGLDQPLSLSCTSTSFCLVVVVDDDALTKVLQFNGTTFRNLAKPSLGQDYSTVSCATPRFCAGFAGDAVAARYHGGAALTDPQVVFPSSGFNGISCPAAKFCMTTSGHGVATTFDGATFGSSKIASADPTYGTHVSCSARSFCALTSGHDAVLYDGVGWHGDQRIDPHRLTAVGCGSARLCAATDNIGRVSMYTGTKWTSPRRIDGTHPLISVSCTGSSLCAALDQQGGVLVYRAGQWSARHLEFTLPPGTSLAFSKVSCGSPTRCVAESDDGSVATYNGHRWLRPSGIVDHPTRDGSGEFGALACTSATFCLATTNLASYTYNGSAWTNVHPIPGIEGVGQMSCASKHWCVAANINHEYVIGRS
jgi:hypothetical protein